MPRTPTLPRRLGAALAATAAAVAGLLLVAPAPAQAATTTQHGSCVDGSGTPWAVTVRWGSVYRDAAGVTRAALDAAGWTTTASGTVATDARVRTYDGTGRLLQDLRSSVRQDYQGGTVLRSRNPLNPPSDPAMAKVTVTLGFTGDGKADCSVTLAQPGSVSDRYEADVIAATGTERAKAGLVRLTPQACVDRYAEAQARAMATNQKMYHQALQPILDACGLARVGENVAYGFDSGTTTTAAWMASPGHRANILEPRYRLIGVGAAQGADGLWYVSQVFGTLQA